MEKKLVKFERTRAHQRYVLKDGTMVPGVTTALKMRANDALLYWAWDCGMGGLDYRKVRDEAANIGSLAHWMCECHVLGQEPDTSSFPKEDIDKASNSFLKFLEWWQGNGMTLVHSERQLVSEQFRFGGTLDIDARDRNGKRILVDLKTSKGIYDEYYAQLAAYDRLHTETGDEPFTRHIIVRIGKKEAGDFEVREISGLDKHWNVFKACLDLYNAVKALK